jgi:hypothetical protein
VRHLTRSFAEGTLRRGREVEQLVEAFEQDGRRGLRWASISPATRTLGPGQSARYRANFRLSGYSMAWTYYDWTVNIAHEPPRDDLFLDRKYDFERDDRVSLCGKPAHR